MHTSRKQSQLWADSLRGRKAEDDETGLRVVDLSQNMCGEKTAAAFASALYHDAFVKGTGTNTPYRYSYRSAEVRLSHNRIDDLGGQQLLEMLAENETLEILDLSGNSGIGGATAEEDESFLKHVQSILERRKWMRAADAEGVQRRTSQVHSVNDSLRSGSTDASLIADAIRAFDAHPVKPVRYLCRHIVSMRLLFKC